MGASLAPEWIQTVTTILTPRQVINSKRIFDLTNVAFLTEQLIAVKPTNRHRYHLESLRKNGVKLLLVYGLEVSRTLS